MVRILPLLIFFVSLMACTNADKSPEEALNVAVDWYAEGEQVATAAQNHLMSQVKAALQKGGPDYAIPFCHGNAGPIMDSLSQAYHCTIQRVSDRNRNPDQHPQTAAEESLMMDYVNRQIVGDTVISQAGNAVFYRPIVIGLETCLKCHGQPGTDIATSTLDKLHELYPEDRATGYQMNDVRGLWKITFREDHQ